MDRRRRGGEGEKVSGRVKGFEGLAFRGVGLMVVAIDVDGT